MSDAALRTIFTVLLLGESKLVSSSRIHDEIYVNLGAYHHCFRLLNGTHETGCQSSMNGYSGIVHIIRNDADVKYVLQDPDNRSPFVVAFPLKVFRNTAVVEKLQNSGRVNGFLVLHLDGDENIPEDFSEDSSCPNKFSSLYYKEEEASVCHEWNPRGTSLRMIHLKLPAFYLHNKTEVQFVVQCYEKRNKGNQTWPLCAAQLSTFFSAAQSTETCMRRNNLFAGLHENEKICDPVQDFNLFAFVPPTNKSYILPSASVVALMARMDSFSLFFGAAYGAASSLAHLVKILAIAEAIGRTKAKSLLPTTDSSQSLLFVLFNGESLDYIGSSRMVWDMMSHRFPDPIDNATVNQSALFDFSHIDLLLELNQLAPADILNPAYFLHADSQSYNKYPQVRVVLDREELVKLSSNMIKIPSMSKLTSLPPSSLQSFLKLNRSIPALLLTNHDSEKFNSLYYNSFLDTFSTDRSKMDQLVRSLTQLANVTTTFLYRYVPNLFKYSKLAQVDEEVVRQLAACFFSWMELARGRTYPSNVGMKACSVFLLVCEMFNSHNLKLAELLPHVFESIVHAFVFILGCTKVLKAVKISGLYCKSVKEVDMSDRGVNASVVRFYSHFLLTYFLGYKIDWQDKPPEACNASYFTDSQTDGIYSYTYAENFMADPVIPTKPYCVISPVRTSIARSPAFDLPNYKYDDPFKDPAGFFSTWTESRWDKIWLRLFLKPDPVWQLVVFFVGLLCLVFSMGIGYLISRTTDLLFTGSSAAL